MCQVRCRKVYCIARCETYVLHCLAPRFIKWPRGEEDTRVIEEFKRAKDFPGVIEAVDGSFIQIRASKEDAAFYICRKKYPVIHFQAVCDACSLFTLLLCR